MDVILHFENVIEINLLDVANPPRMSVIWPKHRPKGTIAIVTWWMVLKCVKGIPICTIITCCRHCLWYFLNLLRCLVSFFTVCQCRLVPAVILCWRAFLLLKPATSGFRRCWTLWTADNWMKVHKENTVVIKYSKS